MPPSRAGRALLVGGILVLAFNLRPAAVSVGPVLHDLIGGLRMTPPEAGVLTALPVLAFAVVGAAAPQIAALVGLHRSLFLALVCLVVGLALRPFTSSVLLFLALSVLGLAGMAAANVLLPSLVKLHFPDRVGQLTALYTTAMSIGLTVASMTTVPLAGAFGSWRWGLLAWAVTGALAVIPWLALLRHDQTLASRPQTITLRQVARTRLGWAMALCFGLQSLEAYAIFGWFAQLFRDAGFSPTAAGLLLGVVTGISIPVSLVGPVVAVRARHQGPVFVSLLGCYVVGYGGLLLMPGTAAWLWALLVGTGTGVFPVVLTLIGLRSGTDDGTAALSGFTQSVGYLMAGIGPFGMGLLYALTGGWTVPLLALLGLVVPLAAIGWYVGRPQLIEDQVESLV